MKEIYVKFIAEELSIKDWQVENCAGLFEDGGTIPFISRYRKEKTGGLDDEQVASLKHWIDVFLEMEKRKKTILETIGALGQLNSELQAEIENCVSSSELEDLYLPYRPKRRTRATAAKEAGLEPLADAMWELRASNPETEARKYIGDRVESVEAALQGARDIIAERLSESRAIRESMRNIYRTRYICSRATKAAGSPEASKYRSYFKFSMPLSKIPAHNLLAMLRAENEGYINLHIDADAEKCSKKIYYEFCSSRSYPSKALEEQIKLAVDDAFKRLIDPSISNEVLKEAKQRADAESISVFGENLRQLLLSAPIGQKRTLAVDPGFRNGCKLACLDEHGTLLYHTIIYPHPPQSEKVKSIDILGEIIAEYNIQAVAIGNGTASRETEQLFKMLALPEDCQIWTVSEDGASIYSASDVAREEFPDEDVTVRGAVSIGRRLMDPLAELVKIDPKNLGIGQYQHDVDQALLKEKLDNTVEMCVNSVGVDLNTASPYLLGYIAGIGPVTAKNIVAFRTENGGFKSREQLLEVPRLGAKAFEQCAGFLRVRNSNNPLDNSAVHPESYGIVEKMAADLGRSVSELVGNAELCNGIEAGKYVSGEFGLPTVNDIIAELKKPGRDPREQASRFEFAEDIHEISDLYPGMELPGIVTNITAFGAFVDIGLHENGLIHISQMGVRGLADPSKVLKLHQHIKVCVISTDLERSRISLKLVK